MDLPSEFKKRVSPSQPYLALGLSTGDMSTAPTDGPALPPRNAAETVLDRNMTRDLSLESDWAVNEIDNSADDARKVVDYEMAYTSSLGLHPLHRNHETQSNHIFEGYPSEPVAKDSTTNDFFWNNQTGVNSVRQSYDMSQTGRQCDLPSDSSCESQTTFYYPNIQRCDGVMVASYGPDAVTGRITGITDYPEKTYLSTVQSTSPVRPEPPKRTRLAKALDIANGPNNTWLWTTPPLFTIPQGRMTDVVKAFHGYSTSRHVH
ncbi:hypothetical protein V5O48_004145 [Marasmius crinis-equi]|uniref:Uncharacterized protein n=1 Tax=Marasmius crinis-equi TaxID=585013 RepID=A0ABR3FQX0_9AGAR